MSHSTDDSEQAETEGDLQERPQHARSRGAILLLEHLVHELALLEHLLVTSLITLLDQIHSLLAPRIRLHLLHSRIELQGSDLGVKHGHTEQQRRCDNRGAPFPAAVHVDVLEHPLHHRRGAPSVVEAELGEVANVLGHVEDVGAAQVGDGGEVEVGGDDGRVGHGGGLGGRREGLGGRGLDGFLGGDVERR